MRYMSLLALFVIAGFGTASGQNVTSPASDSSMNPTFDEGIYINKPQNDRAIIVGRPNDGPLHVWWRAPKNLLSLPQQCFDIMSYNFSSGDSPKLQNVTTCTPGATVSTRKIRRTPATPSDGLLNVDDKKQP